MGFGFGVLVFVKDSWEFSCEVGARRATTGLYIIDLALAIPRLFRPAANVRSRALTPVSEIAYSGFRHRESMSPNSLHSRL